MNYRVGRITLAVALIAVGAVLVYDNVTGTALAWSIFRMWPALLILVGLEWIVASAGSESHVRTDGGAIALLIIGAIVLGVVSSAQRTVNNLNWTFFDGPPVVFGNVVVSGEVTTGYEPRVQDLAHLMISGGPATVIVEEDDDFELELEVRAAGRDRADAEANARRARLMIESGSTTKVGLDLPQGVSFQSLVIKVRVPETVKLTITTASGSVEVSDRKADLSVSTSSGSIRAEDVVGRVDLRASSGSITARDIAGSLNAISSSGSLRLEKVDGDLEANATSGSVNVLDVTGKLAAHSSSGTVTVDTGAVGGPFDLGSVSGSVRLTVPRSADLAIDARTSSGSVSGPAWLILGEGRGSARGTQGSGAHQITLRTTSGSIFINSR